MATSGAGVREGLASLRYELPFVSAGGEGQLKDSERVCVSHLTVGLGISKDAMRILSAGTDDEFSNAVGEIKLSIRVLGREAFIIVVVAVDNNVRVGRIQVLPEQAHLRVVSVFLAGTEKWVMPKGDGAGARMGGQVLAEPLFFGRTCAAATGELAAIAVDSDHVPGTEVVAVISLCRIAAGGAKIIEVRSCPAGVELVVARGRPGARLCHRPDATREN